MKEKKMIPRNKFRLTANLPLHQLGLIDALAEKSNISKSEVIRRMIDDLAIRMLPTSGKIQSHELPMHYVKLIDNIESMEVER